MSPNLTDSTSAKYVFIGVRKSNASGNGLKKSEKCFELVVSEKGQMNFPTTANENDEELKKTILKIRYEGMKLGGDYIHVVPIIVPSSE